MLNFYSSPLSPFAQKIHFFLEESGIPYKLHNVDLAKGDQRQEAYRKINPFGQVPAIELNGFGLGESNAILRYLAGRYEKTDWYPTNLEDRASVDRLMEFSNLHVNRWFIALYWNLHLAPRSGRPVDPWAIEQARSNLPGNLAKLETHLLGRKHLYGPTLTLADAVLLPGIGQHKLAQVSLSDYPAIQSWLQGMQERPAWKKVLAELEKPTR